MSQQTPVQIVAAAYRRIVEAHHPNGASRWPILTGMNVKLGSYNGWIAVFLEHTGNPLMTSTSGVGELSSGIIGAPNINETNLEGVRERLLRHFRATLDDALVLIPPSGELLPSELEKMLMRHEAALGIGKMKIFLSHKSPDKALVRDFKTTLEVLGFDPWLDEDAMVAGAQLDRSILKGMQDSCGAVFFLDPSVRG